MLADLDSRSTGGNGPEFRANAGGSIRLQIKHVLGGGAALKVNQEDALGLARPTAGGASLHGQQAREVEEAAQERQGPRLQGLPARQPVAAEPRASQQRDHGGFSSSRHKVQNLRCILPYLVGVAKKIRDQLI